MAQTDSAGVQDDEKTKAASGKPISFRFDGMMPVGRMRGVARKSRHVVAPRRAQS